MSAKAQLNAAAAKANDLVIAMSLGIMDPRSSEVERGQARMLQSLFSGITGVLAEAARGYWAPGDAPDDWESFDSSRAVLKLADSVLDMEKNVAGAR